MCVRRWSRVMRTASLRQYHVRRACNTLMCSRVDVFGGWVGLAQLSHVVAYYYDGKVK